MKSNFEIEFELVEWIRKTQWCKYIPYEVVIPDNDQFTIEIKTPFMLGGSQLYELADYMKNKNLCWLLRAGDKEKELIISIWEKKLDLF